MIARFGRPVPVISMITNEVMRFIYKNHHQRLPQWNQFLLSPENMQEYANAVHRAGAALDNCFGFMDGTVRPICRPGHEQRLVYNGHKRVHALKFQSTSLPNGIIAKLFDPVGMSKFAFYISATFNSTSPPFANSSHFIVNDLLSSTMIFVLECETLVAHIDLCMITFIFRRKDA